jgi:soluble lytic murein transglycosylase-like protein
MKALFILFATSVCAMAGEYAVLTNGQRIHADSHEKDGGMIRLVSKSGATIEFPADKVSGFEQEEYVAPPPPPAVQNVAVVTAVADSTSDRALSAKEIITQAALKAGLPPEILHSVAKAESGYHSNAISPKGAIGLMQLMPQTAAALNANPYDPRQNAEAGAEYLARLLIKYQNDTHQVSKAVAAYNAGPGAVDKYKGIPPYRETVNYVNRVINDYNKQTAKKRAASASLTD